MADTKISALTALAGASVATDDVLPIVDTSATETKKITVTELLTGVLGSTSKTGATETASKPLLDMAQTWNNAGVTFGGWKLNITDTASAAASKLVDLQVASSSIFSVTKAGKVNVPNTGANGSTGYSLADVIALTQVGSNITLLGVPGQPVAFGPGGATSINSLWAQIGDGYLRFMFGGTADCGIRRVDAGIISVSNGSTGGGALGFVEQTAPSAPATNGVYLYAEDNGGGKTRLMARFATGAAQQVAIEP